MCRCLSLVRYNEMSRSHALLSRGGCALVDQPGDAHSTGMHAFGPVGFETRLNSCVVCDAFAHNGRIVVRCYATKHET